MIRLLVPCIGLLLCAGSTSAQQFTAVKVEAEDFASKHSDWRLTTSNSTPNVSPDPDGSHASSASGRAYMELLPDTRVTHSDQLISGRNFWNNAGTGPSLSYNVNIPEAGRYLVFVKAYSTGTEDNGIHVGLNGNYPASGERMQWCGGKNQWTWGSAQRTTNNHCGTQRTIYLDFSFAGANTVNFSAREDGFEFDQFILLKTNNNTCAPNNNDQIACNTGTINIPAQPEPTPQPEPEPQPEPAPALISEPEAMEPPAAEATQPVLIEDFPLCTSATSDPDGDGFGWENNASCVVDADAISQSSPSQGTFSSLPVCLNANSDPDGDGYGWENNTSCVMDGTSAANNLAEVANEVACESAASDPDGDGWGWENSQSCRVQ